MAASYIICLTIRHPFVDGNKRTALASALTFLYLSGYEVEESYDLELADLVLEYALSGQASPDLADFWLFSFPFIIYQLNIFSCAA